MTDDKLRGARVDLVIAHRILVLLGDEWSESSFENDCYQDAIDALADVFDIIDAQLNADA